MQQKKWGDQKVGDYVFGADGTPTRIIGTNRYRREHFRVTFDDGSSTIVSGEHEWNVRGRQERRKKSDAWRTIETQEIIALGVKRANGKAQARQWEIPVQGAAQFSTSHGLPLDPYVMGVWLSDGSGPKVSKSSQAVRMKIQDRHHSSIRILDQKHIYLHKLDRSLDPVFACRSWEKYIPERYKFASVEQRQSLFEGLMDGDGEVNKSGSCGYSSSSEKLVDDVIWLARSLGYKAMKQPTVKKPTYTYKGEKLDGRHSYRATINTPTNPFTHESRRAAWKPSEPRYLSRWIESIESVGMMDGMCITVEAEDHLYQANDFIVTHNSALSSWVIIFIMATRPHSKGVVTANTSEQLKTKTWGELGKWLKRCICGHWFTYNNGKGNMNLYHPEFPESWRVDGQTCREENSESFAGLHAANSSPWYLFDEASAVPDKIWEVAEGGLTDGEPFWFVFGNPTRNTGRFRECFRKYKHRWNTRQVDSRQARMTNKKLIKQWEDDYGANSDFFKVRVRGLFPSASELQFVPQHLVDDAMGRTILEGQIKHAPVILGVDPAWSGTDEMAIYMRQGLFSKLIGTYEKTDDDVRMASVVANLQDEWDADAVFIDFGYGTGMKSVGDSWGRRWQLVSFGGKSVDPQMLNKRGEMWNSLKKWLGEGGAIDDQPTADEITAPEYRVKLDGKIVLESKDDMKRRGVPSPNRADALALTFAHPVAPRATMRGQQQPKAQTEFNPWE